MTRVYYQAQGGIGQLCGAREEGCTLLACLHPSRLTSLRGLQVYRQHARLKEEMSKISPALLASASAATSTSLPQLPSVSGLPAVLAGLKSPAAEAETPSGLSESCRAVSTVNEPAKSVAHYTFFFTRTRRAQASHVHPCHICTVSRHANGLRFRPCAMAEPKHTWRRRCFHPVSSRAWFKCTESWHGSKERTRRAYVWYERSFARCCGGRRVWGRWRNGRWKGRGRDAGRRRGGGKGRDALLFLPACIVWRGT